MPLALTRMFNYIEQRLFILNMLGEGVTRRQQPRQTSGGANQHGEDDCESTYLDRSAGRKRKAVQRIGAGRTFAGAEVECAFSSRAACRAALRGTGSRHEALLPHIEAVGDRNARAGSPRSAPYRITVSCV